MDILAARKKAAEQAGAANKTAQEAAAPAVQPAPEQEMGMPEAQPVSEQEAAMPEVQPAPEREASMPEAQPAREPDAPPPAEAGPGGTVASPAAAVGAPVIVEPRDKAGGAPVSSADEPEETEQQEIELLSFRLGGEEYAVPVADVREVLKNYQLTIVPNTPDYLLGVMSLRGTMLPIIDLCKRFGLAPGAKDAKSRIVVVSSADEDAGLLVDRVTGVFRVLPDEIKPVPENIEQGAEFLSGIVRTADRLFILLDLDKALGV